MFFLKRQIKLNIENFKKFPYSILGFDDDEETETTFENSDNGAVTEAVIVINDESVDSDYEDLPKRPKRNKRRVVDDSDNESNSVKSNNEDFESESESESESEKKYILKHGLTREKNCGIFQLRNDVDVVKIQCGQNSNLSNTNKNKKTKEQKDTDSYNIVEETLSKCSSSILLFFSSKKLNDKQLDKCDLKKIDTTILIENKNTPKSVNNSNEHVTICYRKSGNVSEERKASCRDKFSKFKKLVDLNKKEPNKQYQPVVTKKFLFVH